MIYKYSLVIVIASCLTFILIILFYSSTQSAYTYLEKTQLPNDIFSTDDCSHSISNDMAVLVVVDKSSFLKNYTLAQKTLTCYCLAHNYSLNYIFLEHDTNYSHQCNQSGFYFRRHCAAVVFMQAHPNFKFILFVDADIGVINPRHRIEEFINERTDAEIKLIFFERLITYEIMAGSYLAKNTLFVHDFLMEWANYTSNQLFNQKKTYHQDDEGALHQVLINRYVSSASNRNICEQVYNSTIDYYAYLNEYVVCARHILGISTRTFGNTIKLIRQGDGWARDGHETATSFWADRDFMFHYWKDQLADLWKFPFLDKNSTLEFKPEKCHVNGAMTREMF
uniref:Nucleotide-diphospho-sugar transferase domain-containing protein n=1 Tax=Ditylenchus dipsaci TaxID=166011 RepID=A0A915CZ36_9BILA